jgi:tRNA (adenine22-N1)-methyltransferase
MKTQLKLSKRLEAISEMVSLSNVVADIGSDHALLPIALVLSGKVTRAYASEVNEGPYEMSVKNIEKYNLQNYITPVLSDGISELEADVNCITICGMGGNLIADILNSNKAKLARVNEIIIQPNNNEETARIWLVNNGYDIDNETIVYEDDVYYEVIKAVKREIPNRYSKEELYFGPVLLKEKSKEFVSKWNKYKDYLNKVISQINNPELSNSKMLSGLVKLIEKALEK